MCLFPEMYFGCQVISLASNYLEAKQNDSNNHNNNILKRIVNCREDELGHHICPHDAYTQRINPWSCAICPNYPGVFKVLFNIQLTEKLILI